MLNFLSDDEDVEVDAGEIDDADADPDFPDPITQDLLDKIKEKAKVGELFAEVFCSVYNSKFPLVFKWHYLK